MSAERLEQAQSIYMRVHTLAAVERDREIVRACGGDAELERLVERLLAQGGQVGDVGLTLDPVAAPASRHVREPLGNAASPIPKNVGGYRILRRVGEGGMGVVYEAQQDHPRRVVALKVIRPAFATPAMLRRFEFEVQVLGQLEHPGIARIYDAGAAESGGERLPFFAMEFIQGAPITRFVHERTLATNERLELVARVCDAVHHAHQKGVIHRDLKPVNILVQPPEDAILDNSGTSIAWNVGQPKVLDFGVARAVGSDGERRTIHTEAGQLVGTLPYMSPEQIAGDSGTIDVRTDVYSLGVVLYEALTGRLPFDLGQKGVVEAARIIREWEPAPPSATEPSFRGDVDTIVLKAMAKDARDRYDSAAQLAADIRRYLRDEPITARPASAMYQLRKLARRHKAVVSGVIIAGLGLIAGTVFAVQQAIMARAAEREVRSLYDRARDAEASALQQRDRAFHAEQEATDALEHSMRAQRQADAVNDFLRDMLASVDPERTADREITMAEVLDGAAMTIGDRFVADPTVELTIRETIGATYLSLGKTEKAAEQWKLVLDLAAKHLGDDDASTHNARTNLALVLRDLDQTSEAMLLAQTAIDGLTRTLGPDDPNTLSARANLALLLSDEARYEEARVILEDVIARRRALGDESSAPFLRNLASLASVHAEAGRLDLAEPLLRESLELRSQTMSSSHPDVILGQNNLASLLLRQGKLNDARQILEQLAASAPQVLGADHPMVFTIRTNLGGLYETIGRPDLAQPIFEEALEYSRRTWGDRHRNTLSQMNNLAGSYESLGRLDLAEPLLVEALNTRREVLGESHPDTIASINNLGFLFRLSKRYRQAEPLFQEAHEKFRATLGERHPSTIIAMSNVGTLYNDMELFSEAETFNEQVNTLAGEVLPETHWFRSLAKVRYGVSLTGSGRFEEAQTLLLDGHAGLEKSLGPDNERTIGATREIVRLYGRWGKPEMEATWRARLPVDQ